jgi:hypothetical protein
VCPVCAVEHHGKNPWQLCPEHWKLIELVRHQLRNAHVPTPLVVALIKDPVCPIDGCEQNLFAYMPDGRRRMLTVDHDPTLGCHPGGPGCELCVRGLICHWDNLALQRDVTPRQHRGRAAYLDAWDRRGERLD